jgi:diamine N-acetyltransferase
MKLLGAKIYLRAIETSDLELLYAWENNTENWSVSHTYTPFSKYVLEQYLVNSHQDIYTNKQLRLMICMLQSETQSNPNNNCIGTIDLFDFEPNHLRCGVGILIAEKSERKKGYASETLQILTNYCFETLNMHQLYCNINTDNEDSILLFQKHGFKITGIKKDWNRSGNNFKDELLLQLIKP